MASFSDTAFDQNAFDVGAWDFGTQPPPPPPPADSGVRPSGGIPATLRVKGRTRKEIAEDRRRFGIEGAVAEVIEAVAQSQVERLEQDEQKRFEELTRELELRSVEFDGRYLRALNELREELITREIAQRLKFQLREEEEIMVLLMLAAAVA